MIVVSLDRPARFAEIFDRHAGSVHRFVGYRVHQSEVDDLVGEVFRIAFEDRAKFNPSASSAKPWLLGIAANLARRSYRTSVRSRRAVQREKASLGSHIDPLLAVDDRLDAADSIAQIEPALQQLPDAERDVLLMTVWDEFTPSQIADVLKIPAATVRTHLFRARKRLRVALEATNQTSPTGTTKEGVRE